MQGVSAEAPAAVGPIAEGAAPPASETLPAMEAAGEAPGPAAAAPEGAALAPGPEVQKVSSGGWVVDLSGLTGVETMVIDMLCRSKLLQLCRSLSLMPCQ